MTSLQSKHDPLAKAVRVTDEALVVELVDGRTLSVPVAWYPRLSHATAEERAEYELTGLGQGIHWPRVDEDLSVLQLLEGRPSGESHDSLAKWLTSRAEAS